MKDVQLPCLITDTTVRLDRLAARTHLLGGSHESFGDPPRVDVALLCLRKKIAMNPG